MRVLLLSSLSIEFGRPAFRANAYLNYLVPLAAAICRSEPDAQCTLLAGDHLKPALGRLMAGRLPERTRLGFLPTRRVLEIFGAGDAYQTTLYQEQWTSEQHAAFSALLARSIGQVPDVILCWESPTTLLRALYPDALVIDLMPGLFMRPPFPRTIQIDLDGLYRTSMLRSIGQDAYIASSRAFDYQALKRSYMEFFNAHPIDALTFCGERRPVDYARRVLLPLQISDHFGFRLNAKYPSQFAYMTEVLSSLPPEIGVIVTQYNRGTMSDIAVTDDNIDFLIKTYPNFLYSERFAQVESVSQYLIPHVDACITVSSTLGLQGVLFDKPLFVAGDTHLGAFGRPFRPGRVADVLLGGEAEQRPGAPGAAMNFLLARATVPLDLVTNGTIDFARLLWELAERRHEDNLLDRTVPVAPPQRLAAAYLAFSSFSQARPRAEFLHGPAQAGPVADSPVRDLLVRMDACDVVSFDVFDTLIERVVYHPRDVFVLVEQAALAAGYTGAAGFARLRVAVERAIRQRFDALAQPWPAYLEGIRPGEEMTLAQIYAVLGRVGPYDAALAEFLMATELGFERALVRPRTAGRFLYDCARARRRRVIAISDTALPGAVVADLLASQGYAVDRLYVSSEIGLKKHTGALYGHVLADLGAAPGRVLHIGDNTVGDIKRASEAGFGTFHLPRVQEVNAERFESRDLDLKTLTADFALRSHLHNYFRVSDPVLGPTFSTGAAMLGRPTLCETPYMFGYLALAPLVYAFTRFIVDLAARGGHDIVGFLARDCWLFAGLARHMAAAGLTRTGVRYIHTSRSAMATIGLSGPKDVARIRLDDFSGRRSLAEILESRFRIRPAEVAPELLARWGIADPDEPVGRIPEFVIRSLVAEVLAARPAVPARADGAGAASPFARMLGPSREVPGQGNDDAGSEATDRAAFLRQLDELGFMTAQNPLIVDFGYKGTIHRAIEAAMGRSLQAAFFAAYTTDLGIPDLGDVPTYFGALNPNLKAGSDFLRFSLIIETLLNKAEGTATSFNEDGLANTGPVGSVRHLDVISAVHEGALDGARALVDGFDCNGMPLVFTPNTACALLFQLLRAPSAREAAILGDLVFDNDFAGHQPRTLIAAGGRSNSIWREGEAALSRQDDIRRARMDFFREGMDILFRYNDVLPYEPMPPEDRRVLLLFGFSGVERAVRGGEAGGRVPAAWACEEVVGLSVVPRGGRVVWPRGDVRESLFLYVRMDAGLKNGKFMVYQDGREVFSRFFEGNGEEGRLLVEIDASRPFFVRKQGWRKAARADDNRRLYWQFRGIGSV